MKSGFLVKMTLGMHRSSNTSASTIGVIGRRFGSVMTRGYVGYRRVRPGRKMFRFRSTSHFIRFKVSGNVAIVKRYLI